MNNNDSINLVLNETIKDFINEVILKKDLTYPSPLLPWEVIHRDNIGQALVLHRLTGAPLSDHLEFTKEKQEMVLRGLVDGLFPKDCAKIARILPETLQRWLALGKRGISPYRDFLLEYNQAEALAIARDNATLNYSGFRGAEFRLSRRWAKHYGERRDPTTAVQVNNSQITTTNLSQLKGEAKRTAIAELLADVEEGEIIE